MPVATGGSGHARRFLCHLPQGREGITSAQIADGSAFDLTKEQLADIAAKDLAAQPAPAKPFPAVEVLRP